MPITRTVLEVAAAHPDRPAIVGPDESLSYAGLVEDSRRVAAAVERLHAAATVPPVPAPETRGIPITAVSIGSAAHAARIVAGLAGYRAVSATIDPRWPLAHRLRVVLTTGIGLVVTDSEDLRDALAARGWGGTVVTPDEFRRIEREVEPAPPPTVRDDDEAFLLLFSSGTTSEPKAFLKTRRQYRANVAVSSAHLGPEPGVATLAPGPLSYSLTLYALIECLATGGEAHLADAFDPITMGQRIERERITRLVGVPAIAQALTDVARRDPARYATLDLVVTGGANLPASIRAGLAAVLPGVRLIGYYGAAEIGFIGDGRDGDGTRIHLYDGIDAQIRDETGAVLPDGALGTLWIHAAACSDGYLAATTDERLRDDGGWATVHDQGRLHGRTLELVGRAGDIAISGGHKIALTEVDRAFDGVPGIGAVSAVAEPHEQLGAVVALVLEGDAPDVETLRAHARERLAPQAVPRRWYRVDELPRTVGGKIRRGEVASLVRAGRVARL
ncbi:long-chain fatty acid--CoA ligase [Pseudoclavibacter chungangensis]|uniref:Long-chain fatty acid--CoA ligase n=1 Tax=Pseudoclavibacter chungangensis TaxID=587635 RepID=A0A7J5BM66_9MICO|nr:fatty acid--CoA ligase family protein [Pseudoclavibacter chungangensis]KAB1651920.1 long-chain fatty acid--CoA ligase [Pseudoclavibacter chungangensis]